MLLALLLALVGCREPPGDEPPAWVGSATCAWCHPEQSAAWTGSHHDLAMQPASAALAPFSGERAEGGGEAARFTREGDDLVVHSGDGQYRVVWTLGVAPVQQYLVALDDGAVHALPWLWDGERWHHLYAGTDDGVPWTAPAHRWNHACAACHTTGFEERTDGATWRSAFAEGDVACEACHGQGSLHVTRRGALPVDLSEPGTWEMQPSGIAARVPARRDHVEIDTCGRCHSLRQVLVEGPPTGAGLLDTHRPAVLADGLYAADGQIEDEVYEWGSFLQSAMYAAGVTCTDCHDPHSARLRADGNALCAGCHLPERFDRPSHHRHDGAQCVDCHMPSRTYMQVDDRRDHSFRVPRPDLAVRLGTREPCTGCHADRDAAWAAGTVAAWFPDGRTGDRHFAEALHAGRTRAPDAPDRLVALLADGEQPAIARATAASLLPRYPTAGARAALVTALTDRDPLVRREAVLALGPAPEAAPLVEDPMLGVRVAASTLFGGEAAREVVHLDAPDGLLALAELDLASGDLDAAEEALRRATEMDPSLVPAWVNLADVQRAAGRDADALATLEAGLRQAPGDAALLHARGLAKVRTGGDGLADLAAAVEATPDEPLYAYVLAVAQASAGDLGVARATAASAYERSPGDPGLLDLLEGYAAQAGDAEAAAAWRDRRQRDAPWTLTTSRSTAR